MSQYSWVESANAAGTDFPLQNLPYGVFASGQTQHIGVAIGDEILDLHACAWAGLLSGLSAESVDACQQPVLNELMSLGNGHWTPLRDRIGNLLSANSPDASSNRARVAPLLVPMKEAEMRLPAQIGDYTDFYASMYHALNVGRMFRPDGALMPNYKHIPIGYHGRASSVVISGTSIRRPLGQSKPTDLELPTFGPSKALDYELEVGIFIGPGNLMGHQIPIDEADSHIFGLCLFNDWSARDIQTWEYQPLGPFLSKSVGSSVSPWVVTMEALAPYRVPAFTRAEDDPEPLAYLKSQQDQRSGGFDINLELYVSSSKMRSEGIPPFRLCRSNFRDLYWTAAQFVAHHTSNGCNLRPGDLFGSGTVSGPTKDSQGCLLEFTERGTKPVRLPTGEERRYLEDGDEVIIRGYCEREGVGRIGFGECRGIIDPAPAFEK